MLVAVAVGASQALAQAMVKEDGNPVFLNNKPILGSVSARPGARVSTGETGYATVYYENGCTRVVEARQTYIVEDDPTCDEVFNDYYDKKAALIVGGLMLGGLGAIIYSFNDDPPASP